jgi:hypothetical protein
MIIDENLKETAGTKLSQAEMWARVAPYKGELIDHSNKKYQVTVGNLEIVILIIDYLYWIPWSPFSCC